MSDIYIEANFIDDVNSIFNIGIVTNCGKRYYGEVSSFNLYDSYPISQDISNILQGSCLYCLGDDTNNLQKIHKHNDNLNVMFAPCNDLTYWIKSVIMHTTNNLNDRIFIEDDRSNSILLLYLRRFVDANCNPIYMRSKIGQFLTSYRCDKERRLYDEGKRSLDSILEKHFSYTFDDGIKTNPLYRAVVVKSFHQRYTLLMCGNNW